MPQEIDFKPDIDFQADTPEVKALDPNTFVGPEDNRNLLERAGSRISEFSSRHPMLTDMGRELLGGPMASEAFRKNNPDVTDVKGPELMTIPGADTLADKVRNAGINTGNYWGGVAGDVASQIINLFSAPFDPRTAGIQELPSLGDNPTLTKAVTELPIINKPVPVTRITDSNLPIASDKADTWFILGHLDDKKAAQLNDMYKSGRGKVNKGYLNESLVDTSADMSDEFGNKIIKIPTKDLKNNYTENLIDEVLANTKKANRPVTTKFNKPKAGTPPYNTEQFGLKPSGADLPYPLNIVPDRLRPPSTNAAVFNALVPESLKAPATTQELVKPIEVSRELPSPEQVAKDYSNATKELDAIKPQLLEKEFEPLQSKLEGAISNPANLVSSEEGALKLRGFSNDQTEKLRRSILKDISSGNKINLADTFTRFDGKVSKSQFDKIVNDIIESGDAAKAAARIRPKIQDTQPAPMRPSPEQDALQELMQNVKAHIVARNEQDQLVKQAKLERITNAMNVKTRGTQGLYDRLSELKGEYPKVTPEQFYQSLNPQMIDRIKDQIFQNPNLGDWEKINTATAFGKAVGTISNKGALRPSEIRLLQKHFGPELTDDLIELHGGLGLVSNPSYKKLIEVGNKLKGVKSSFDIGWPLRQGRNYVGRPAWFKALAPSMKAYISEDSARATLNELKNHPLYQHFFDNGLAITDFKGSNPLLREESNQANFSPAKTLLGRFLKFPIEASNRAQVAGLDTLRMSVAEHQYDLYKKLHNSLKKTTTDPALLPELEKFNPDTKELAQRIADEVNTATGRGSLGKLEAIQPELNATLFSPRMISAQIKTLNRVFNPLTYLKYDKIQRKEAIKQLLSISGLVGSTLLLSKLRDGDTTGNLTDADFAKARFGNTRLDPTGSLSSYIVPTVKMLTGVSTSSTSKKLGEINKFGAPSGTELMANAIAGNRPSPLLGLAEAWMNAAEFGGKPLNFKSFNPFENTAARSLVTPMVLQDIYDVIMDDPKLVPWIAGPDFFGMNVNTYGTEKDKAEQKTERERLKNRPKPQLKKLGPFQIPVR